MARQLTLFGKLSQERSVYQVPANDYEKFVNFYVAGKFARLPIAEAERLADGEWRCHGEDKRFVEEVVRKAAAEAEWQVWAPIVETFVKYCRCIFQQLFSEAV